MSAQIARITLTFSETGDVLFEQVHTNLYPFHLNYKLWPAWLSHDHVSNNQNIEQELPFDTTKFRSEAVSSMLQVLSQLSREIDKGGKCFVSHNNGFRVITCSVRSLLILSFFNEC
jgi:hypothetical protein